MSKSRSQSPPLELGHRNVFIITRVQNAGMLAAGPVQGYHSLCVLHGTPKSLKFCVGYMLYVDCYIASSELTVQDYA
jgi:hypothetical protein